MRRQTRLALIGAATAIVVGVGGMGIASADDIAAGNNPLTNLLSKLVGNGTITQNQADAIVKAADEDRTAHEAAREAHETAKHDAIAKALGLEWSAIEARLQKGETLAAIAGDKKDAVISALVKIEQDELAQRVKDGVLTEAQATQIKATLTERVTAIVEGKFGPGHHGRGMGMRGGPMGPMGGMRGDDHHGFGFGEPGHGPGHHEDFDDDDAGTPESDS